MIGLATMSVGLVERCVFLGGQAQYLNMGRRFRRGGGDFEWTDLLLPLALVAVVAAIGWLASRYLRLREKQKADSPQTLFAELCQAHGLDWANQQLLRALANAHRMDSPAQLFVEPNRFDVASLGALFENRRDQLAELRTKLFADAGL